MHSNVTKIMLPAKMLSWPHFSWTTLYIYQLKLRTALMAGIQLTYTASGNFRRQPPAL